MALSNSIITGVGSLDETNGGVMYLILAILTKLFTAADDGTGVRGDITDGDAVGVAVGDGVDVATGIGVVLREVAAGVKTSSSLSGSSSSSSGSIVLVVRV